MAPDRPWSAPSACGWSTPQPMPHHFSLDSWECAQSGAGAGHRDASHAQAQCGPFWAALGVIASDHILNIQNLAMVRWHFYLWDWPSQGIRTVSCLALQINNQFWRSHIYLISNLLVLSFTWGYGNSKNNKESCDLVGSGLHLLLLELLLWSIDFPELGVILVSLMNWNGMVGRTVLFHFANAKRT